MMTELHVRYWILKVIPSYIEFSALSLVTFYGNFFCKRPLMVMIFFNMYVFIAIIKMV